MRQRLNTLQIVPSSDLSNQFVLNIATDRGFGHLKRNLEENQSFQLDNQDFQLDTIPQGGSNSHSVDQDVKSAKEMILCQKKKNQIKQRSKFDYRPRFQTEMANEKTASSFESHNKFTFSSSIDKEAKIRVRDTGNIKEGEVDQYMEQGLDREEKKSNQYLEFCRNRLLFSYTDDDDSEIDFFITDDSRQQPIMSDKEKLQKIFMLSSSISSQSRKDQARDYSAKWVDNINFLGQMFLHDDIASSNSDMKNNAIIKNTNSQQDIHLLKQSNDLEDILQELDNFFAKIKNSKQQQRQQKQQQYQQKQNLREKI